MKKTLISLSCLIVAIGLAVSVKTAHEQNLSIQLLDANVEALSDDEGGLAQLLGCTGGPVLCFNGTINYPEIPIEGSWYIHSK